MLDRNKDCDLFGDDGITRRCGCGLICHCKTTINQDGTVTFTPNAPTRARNKRYFNPQGFNYRGIIVNGHTKW